MPSIKELPTIADLVKVFGNAVLGESRTANVRRGGRYDVLGGSNAILWSRETQRDRDLFDAIYLDGASGENLDERVFYFFGATRLASQFGTGRVTFARASAAAGAGTFYAGTRIFAIDPTSIAPPRIFVVAANTLVAATATTVTVPIRTEVAEPGNGLEEASSSVLSFRVDDVTWDPTWAVLGLACAPGISYEKDADFLSRVRQERVDARLGMLTRLEEACVEAGAQNFALFESFRSGDASDGGLNVCYVGDDAFNGSVALARAVALALEPVRVLGADLEILSMVRAELTLEAEVKLWAPAAQFDLVLIDRLLRGAAFMHFAGRLNPYLYSLDAVRADMIDASENVQDVIFSLPASEPSLSSLSWPATLSRFVLSESAIHLTFTGP